MLFRNERSFRPWWWSEILCWDYTCCFNFPIYKQLCASDAPFHIFRHNLQTYIYIYIHIYIYIYIYIFNTVPLIQLTQLVYICFACDSWLVFFACMLFWALCIITILNFTLHRIRHERLWVWSFLSWCLYQIKQICCSHDQTNTMIRIFGE